MATVKRTAIAGGYFIELGSKDIEIYSIANDGSGNLKRVDDVQGTIRRLTEEAGLDPQTRKLLWSVIYSLRRNENMTVFLTTHYMEEASEADYVVILDGGKISDEGTPLELKNKYTSDYITLYSVSEDAVKSLGVEYKVNRDSFVLTVENTARATELIIKNPEIFTDYEITKGKMDDVFLAVTGKKLLGGEDK